MNYTREARLNPNIRIQQGNPNKMTFQFELHTFRSGNCYTRSATNYVSTAPERKDQGEGGDSGIDDLMGKEYKCPQ